MKMMHENIPGRILTAMNDEPKQDTSNWVLVTDPKEINSFWKQFDVTIDIDIDKIEAHRLSPKRTKHQRMNEKTKSTVSEPKSNEGR